MHLQPCESAMFQTTATEQRTVCAWSNHWDFLRLNFPPNSLLRHSPGLHLGHAKGSLHLTFAMTWRLLWPLCYFTGVWGHAELSCRLLSLLWLSLQFSSRKWLIPVVVWGERKPCQISGTGIANALVNELVFICHQLGLLAWTGSADRPVLSQQAQHFVPVFCSMEQGKCSRPLFSFPGECQRLHQSHSSTALMKSLDGVLWIEAAKTLCCNLWIKCCSSQPRGEAAGQMAWQPAQMPLLGTKWPCVLCIQMFWLQKAPFHSGCSWGSIILSQERMLQQFLGHLLPSLPLKWPDQVEVCFHQEEKLQRVLMPCLARVEKHGVLGSQARDNGYKWLSCGGEEWFPPSGCFPLWGEQQTPCCLMSDLAVIYCNCTQV